MSLTDDQIAKLSAGFDQQNQIIADVQQDIVTLQTDAANSGDQATADKLQAILDKQATSIAALQSVDDQTPNPPAEPPVEPTV